MANKRRRSGGAITAPDLPQQKLEKAPPGNWIEDGMNCIQSILARNDLSGLSVRHLSFDQIFFEQVELSRTHIEYVRVLDSRFEACNFANAKWMQADFARVELLGCNLTGFQANEARFQDTFFKECIGHYVQCALAKFEAARFENCDLSDANFFEADLSGAVFVNCDLSNADFSGAKLVSADLRGSKTDGIRISSRELHGATIDPIQALALVRGMGISVKAPEENQ